MLAVHNRYRQSDLYFFHRQIRLEKELKSLLWKIDYSEIMIKRSDSGYSMTADDNLGLEMEIQVQDYVSCKQQISG